MNVAIATSSPDKISGVKKAVSEFFNIDESEIKFYSSQVESGVPEQPFGDETYQGAINRLNGIKEIFPKSDFYISCEAGIEKAFGQYFNVQVVCIYEADTQMFLWGKSAGWSIRAEDIEKIRKSNLDNYLREKGVTRIEDFLGSSHSRSSAVAQATSLALASGKIRNN